MVSLQDLGAAGLTSSASEMASKGEVGIDIDVAGAPARAGDAAVRDHGVGVPGADAVRGRARGRGRGAGAVREVGGRWRGNRDGHRHPPHAGLRRRAARRGDAGEGAGGRVPAVRPATGAATAPIYATPVATLSPGAAARDAAGPAALPQHRLAPPAVRAVRRDRAVPYVCRPAQADAAVLALPDGSALAVSIDCNGRRVAADPYRGTIEVVLECAANLACVGAEPLGPPTTSTSATPRSRTSPGSSANRCAARRRLPRPGAPIVGGNVSLYNEGAAGPIYPTPVVGMVGRLPDAARAGGLGFAAKGTRSRWWGRSALAGRKRAREAARGAAAGRVGGDRPRSGAGGAGGRARRGARRALSSAHDIAEGGLAVALAECCLAGERRRRRVGPSSRRRPSTARGSSARGRAALSSAAPRRRWASSAERVAAADDRRGRGRGLQIAPARTRVTLVRAHGRAGRWLRRAPADADPREGDC